VLKCATCGTLVQEDKTFCGLCGSTRLYPAVRTLQPITSQQLRPAGRGRSRAVLVLVVGVATVAEGAMLAFLPIFPTLTVVGFFMMMFGTVFLLAVTGVFSGTPYRSRMLNRADRELKRREKKRYSD
jgi:hypothetical protein